VLEWTEGFSLLELLRARRELNADEVLRLLPQAADGVDHALNTGLKRLDLGLHQVFVHFAAAPVERVALLRQPVESWPSFTLKLNPLGITHELSLSETWAGAQTMVGGMAMPSNEAPDARARCIQALGAICYELLGGTLSPLAFGTPGSPRYTPLATLTEEGNNVLRRALDPSVSFPTAYEFYQTLNGLDGLEAKRHETKAATTAPRTTAPSPPTQPVPHGAPRQKVPVAFFSGLATVGLIAAVIYIISQDEAPKPPDEGNPTTKQAIEQEEDSPPITPGAESLTLAPEPEIAEPAPPTPPTRQEMLRTAAAAAEALEHESKWAEAIAAWVQIAKEYPDYEKGKAQLELVISHLLERPAAENANDFPALREPVTAAAELEVRSAMMFLGEMLRKSEPQAAFKWFDAAAKKGDLAALTQVGLMYSNGKGVEADLNKAIEAFREGSEKGHPTAKTALAECYLWGKNVPKDEARAVELLKEAVEGKHPLAMDLLGTCYHDGIGVKADYAEAFRLYSEAVELGHLDSLGNLGVLYVMGHGVRRNPAKAVELFKRGAEAGNAACMFFYAQCFESGIGIGQKNLLQAQSWYRQAAEAGNPLAAAWCREKGVPFKVR
jgi:TPR repeat protein